MISEESKTFIHRSVLLGPESTVENLIGVFKPTLGKNMYVITVNCWLHMLNIINILYKSLQ
jgi:hypothetical protein